MKPSPRLSTRLKRSAIAFSVLVLSSCGGPKKSASMAPPPTAVEVATVRSGGVIEKLQALGTVEPAESVRIATEIDAVVHELPFQEGSRVRKGQPIALLNDTEPLADARRTEALRDQAKLTFKRMDELSGQKIAAAQDRDLADAALKVAEANLNVSRARLAKTKILAPFDGVIGQRLVSPGAFLRTGDVIATLSRLDPVKVVFAIPERYRAQMRQGSAVTVSAVASPGHAFTGHVSLIDPLLDSATRTSRLVALVPNPRFELSPGMSAEVSSVLSERPAALTVPDEAVFAEGDRNYVYVVKEDKSVTRRAIKLGTRQAGAVEVVDGLKSGESVVRAGHQKLFEGAHVAPAESLPAAHASTSSGL